MRWLSASLIGLTVLTGLTAQQAGKNKAGLSFGLEVDADTYPQTTPQAALGSALKALAAKRFDYLLAHLADPAFVKGRLKIYKSEMPAALAEESKDVLAFQRLVKATTEHFREDPTRIRELGRFAKDGAWNVTDNAAVAVVKTLPARKVFLKKIGERWYLEDRDK